MKSYSITLASSSPRRRELIKKIPWLTATVFSPFVDESAPVGVGAILAAQIIAERKARAAYDICGGVTLGADTMVCVDDLILGKPKDILEAENMFRLLCGRTHYVITGYCIVSKDKIIKNYEKTFVTFGAFVDKIVYNYIRSDSPYDKAGGYGLQDASIAPLIERVDGDRDNVIGLPVSSLNKVLKEFYLWQ